MYSSSTVRDLKFKGFWRSYQQRVLDELESHLNDGKLNVVAAPGAGKTTLGIEVLVRLGSAALVIAPTITIRNQWRQRIIDHFLPDGADAAFISTDIKRISEITVSTYQGVHALCKDTGERARFIEELKDRGVRTLILDEAHHLRTEWWAVLKHLCEELSDDKPRIVSLTGTPPYDVTSAEWNRYHSLCGSVDAEISIPELVKAGDLCPHQDLIYFSDLTGEEQQVIFDFRANRDAFFKSVNESSDVLYAIEESPFVSELDEHVDLIYENVDFTVALISYLLKEDSLSMSARILAEFLELRIEQIPPFDNERAEILFNGMIGEFQKVFKNVPRIRRKLKEHHLLKGNKVDFTGKFNIRRLVGRSKNKLHAIRQITIAELEHLNGALREVVLLDYVGKGDGERVNVLSVFDNLRQIRAHCGVLTGSLVVIPKSAQGVLREILRRERVEESRVLAVAFSDDFVRLETYGDVNIVAAVTELFERGDIQILIGTAALLGEGWDAPCVNTLILASTVGSFMLSNQMRGRALRIDKKNGSKSSDIWHLVSLVEQGESEDVSVVQRRFNTFEGISYDGKGIQNGMERLAINPRDIRGMNCDSLNKKMLGYASERSKLAKKWEQAFKKSPVSGKQGSPRICHVVLGGESQRSILRHAASRRYYGLDRLIRHCSMSRKSGKIRAWEKAFLKICHRFQWITDGYEGIISRNVEMYARENTLKHLARALLSTLRDVFVVKTRSEKTNLDFHEKENSEFCIMLEGCSDYERNLFVGAFVEMFSIHAKNRYILKRGDQYIAVPKCISGSGKTVRKFVAHLKRQSESFEIVYTKNPDGYRELLKARFNVLNGESLKQRRIWM